MDAANPYVGPRPFQHGETLYGRDHAVAGVLSTLIAKRVVLLYSPSGAGKTSLIQAALIPRLEERDFQVLPIIRVKSTPPPVGNRYVYSTVLSLEEGLPAAEQLPLTRLTQMTIPEYLAHRLAHSELDELVLVFDQFEELLTLDPTDHAAKHAFLLQLGDALREMDNYWVLFAMREDYVASLAPYTRVVPSRLKQTVRLDLLDMVAAQQAVQQPARTMGVSFTDAAVTRLCNDLRRVQVQQPDGTLIAQLGASIEPVQLQVVCLRLWDNVPDGTKEIGTDEVAQVGDVDTALAAYYAEQVARSARVTGVSERSIREWVETELVTEQGVRGQVLKGVATSAGLDNAVIQQLIDAHLLRAERRRGATWFELAHDRLVEPVHQDNTQWREAHLSHLQRQAALWEQEHRPDGLLLRGDAFRDGEDWAAMHADALTEGEHAFLDACRQAHALAEEREAAYQRELEQAQALAAEQQRRVDEQTAANVRLRLRAVYMGIALVAALAIAITMGAVFTIQAERSVENAQQQSEESQAQFATAEARRLYLEHLAPHARVFPLVVDSQFAWSQGNVDQALSLALTAVHQDERSVPAQTALVAAAYTPGAYRRFVSSVTDAACVAFSPDGRRVLLGSQDGTVTLWDVERNKQLQTFDGHADWIMAVAFAPDGQAVLSASWDMTVRQWDVVSGKEQHRFALPAPAVGIAFRPDGRQVLAALSDGSLRIWDAPNGREVVNFRVQAPCRGHIAEVALAFSPDGNVIAEGCLGETIQLWDVASGMQLHRLMGHETPVSGIAFRPDGRQLVSGDWAGVVRVWDVSRGLEQYQLAGHTRGVGSVAFSPDGHLIASAAEDVCIWDAITGVEQSCLRGHRAQVSEVTFSPDGTLLASSADDVRVWHVEPYPRLHQFAGFAGPGIFHPDGRTVLVIGVDHALWLIDVEQGTTDRRLIEYTGQVHSLAVSPNGELVVFGTDDGMVRVWNVHTGQVQWTTVLPAMTDAAPSATTPVAHRGVPPVTDVAFVDDQTVLAGADDGSVRVWDIQTDQEVRAVRTEGQPVRRVASSADGQWVFAGTDEGTIFVWSLHARGDTVPSLHQHGAVTCMQVHPDGQTLLTCSSEGVVSLWNIEQGKRVQHIVGHAQSVQQAMFDTDGHVFSASTDGTMRFWDVASGQEQYRIGVPMLRYAALSPDGQTALSVSSDGTLALWQIAPVNDIVSWVEANRYIPELTCEQRASYDIQPLCDESGRIPSPIPTPTQVFSATVMPLGE